MVRVKEAAQNGMSFLDRICGKVGIIPCNWREKIDKNILDIDDPHSCVLGQVGGYYYDVIEELVNNGFVPEDDDERDEFEYDHGFMVDYIKYEARESIELTEAWKELLDSNK